jgi:Tol biopolymer transport system component
VRNLWRITIDPASQAWIDGPDRLTTSTGADAEGTPSPDGTRLAFSTFSSRPALWAFPFDPARGRIGSTGEPLRAWRDINQGTDVQADGHRVVYRSTRGNRQELWEHSDSGDRLLLTASDWTFSAPRWSPDGQKVIFARARSNGGGAAGDTALAILAIGEGHEQLVTTPGAKRLVPTDWSDDGKWVLTACNLSTRSVGICLLPVSAAPHAEASMQVLAARENMDLFQQRFSPDERWISFIAVSPDDRSTSTVYVMPRSGGAWKAVTDGTAYDDKPRWAPDGRTLYFISNRGGTFDVWGRRMDPATGTPDAEPFRVTDFARSARRLAPSLQQMDMTVLADRILLPMYEASGQIWMLEHVDQ